MKKLRGFTLVEIMIVVAIIVLLAAIAIPNLLRARLNANEAAAVAGLGTVSTAAQSFRGANPGYPTVLTSLSGATPPYIDSVIGSGAKQGYSFTLAGTANAFEAQAAPITWSQTGVRTFYVNQSGVITYTNTAVWPMVAGAGSVWSTLE